METGLHPDRKGGICKADTRRAIRRTGRFGRQPYGGTPKSAFRPTRAYISTPTIVFETPGYRLREWQGLQLLVEIARRYFARQPTSHPAELATPLRMLLSPSMSERRARGRAYSFAEVSTVE